jgi:hypothetical protein
MYTSTLGILDYLDMLQGGDRKYFELKKYRKEFGLGVTVLCILGCMVAFPVWFLQVSNKCKKRKKVETFSIEKEDGASLHSLGVLKGEEGKVTDEEDLTYNDTSGSGCCCFHKKNFSVVSQATSRLI